MFEEVNYNINEFIGKKSDEIEKILGFDYYIETKDKFLLGKEIDSKKLINSFIEFNKNTNLKVIKLIDGIIEEIIEMNFNEIKKNLILLSNQEGIFYDEDLDNEFENSYIFLCNDYFAEIMDEIIFFSGKKEFVINFKDVLKENDIEYHEPVKISEIGKDIEIEQTKKKKLGRNESCHCGSGIKYKKCCLNEDIEKKGKPMKVDELWEEGYFAETLSSDEIKQKQRTIHMKHDEEMNYDCKKCKIKISAHNKDWHAGLCDDCFNDEMKQE